MKKDEVRSKKRKVKELEPQELVPNTRLTADCIMRNFLKYYPKELLSVQFPIEWPKWPPTISPAEELKSEPVTALPEPEVLIPIADGFRRSSTSLNFNFSPNTKSEEELSPARNHFYLLTTMSKNQKLINQGCSRCEISIKING